MASTGAPLVMATPPWTLSQKDLAVHRGPHISVAHQFTDFLLSDMYDYVSMGYWTVLHYLALRSHPALRLAPV
jgi:hypothetical protein